MTGMRVGRKAQDGRYANLSPEEKLEYHRQKRRRTYYRYHEENKALLRERARAIKADLVALKGGMCMDCGFTGNPVCFHFDHRDPWEKVANIQALCSKKRSEELRLELQKCDLVCANCHAIRTSENPEVHKKASCSRRGLPRPDGVVPVKKKRAKKTYW